MSYGRRLPMTYGIVADEFGKLDVEDLQLIETISYELDCDGTDEKTITELARRRPELRAQFEQRRARKRKGPETPREEMTLSEYVHAAWTLVDWWHEIPDDEFGAAYDDWLEGKRSRYAETRAQSRAVQDSWAFFSRRSAAADYERWKTIQALSADEATALSFGKDPTKVNSLTVAAYSPGPAGSEFKETYEQRLDLIRRAQSVKTLQDPIKPADFERWALGSNVPWPGELSSVKLAFDHELEAAKKEIEELRELLQLQETGDGTDPKKRSFDLRLILGMALSRYGYITDKNDSAVKNIVSDLSELKDFGLDVGMKADAVGKKLAEAAGLLEVRTTRAVRTMPTVPQLRIRFRIPDFEIGHLRPPTF